MGVKRLLPAIALLAVAAISQGCLTQAVWARWSPPEESSKRGSIKEARMGEGILWLSYETPHQGTGACAVRVDPVQQLAVREAASIIVEFEGPRAGEWDAVRVWVSEQILRVDPAPADPAGTDPLPGLDGTVIFDVVHPRREPILLTLFRIAVTPFAAVLDLAGGLIYLGLHLCARGGCGGC